MQTAEARFLLMLGLALGSAISGAVEGQRTPVSRDALFSAVRRYNRNSGLDSAFHLLQVKYGDASNAGLQNLRLILQETVCPNSRNLNLDDCDFKDDGVLKECSRTPSAQPGSPVLQIQCVTIPPGANYQVEPTKVPRFFRRPKKLVSRGGSNIAQAKPTVRIHIA